MVSDSAIFQAIGIIIPLVFTYWYMKKILPGGNVTKTYDQQNMILF